VNFTAGLSSSKKSRAPNPPPPFAQASFTPPRADRYGIACERSRAGYNRDALQRITDLFVATRFRRPLLPP